MKYTKVGTGIGGKYQEDSLLNTAHEEWMELLLGVMLVVDGNARIFSKVEHFPEQC